MGRSCAIQVCPYAIQQIKANNYSVIDYIQPYWLNDKLDMVRRRVAALGGTSAVQKNAASAANLITTFYTLL